MFGRPVTAAVYTSSRAPNTTRQLPLLPRQLASALATLGNVLYLPRGDTASLPEPPAAGLLTDTLMLLPLLRTRHLHIGTAVTADGPREWMDCVDADGYPLARIYLLPDTDYGAWDALLAYGGDMPLPATSAPSSQSMRARGQVLSFTQRRLGGLTMLSCVLPSRMSALGTELAQEIARNEAVRLSVPH